MRRASEPEVGANNELEVSERKISLSANTFLEDVEQLLYGFLFAMVQKRESPSQLPYIILLLDVAQFWSLSMHSDLPWGSERLQGYVVFFQRSGAYFGFPFFVVLLTVTIGAVFGAFFNAYYVGKSFKRGSFKHVWPVKTLRFLVTMVVTVGFIPIVNVLLISINCTSVEGRRVWRYLPTVVCWSWPSLVASVLSIITLITFVPFALIMSLVYFDSRPRSKNPSARATARLTLLFVACKTVVSISLILIPGVLLLKATLYALATFLLFGSHLFLVPYYHDRMNLLASALYAALSMSGVAMVAVVIIDDASNSYLLPAALVAFVPSLGAGYLIGAFRLNRLRTKAFEFVGTEQLSVAEMVEARKNVRKKHIFGRPSSVEMHARFLAKKRKVEGDLFAKIFEIGIIDFPASSEVINSYAMYLASYGKNSAEAARLRVRAQKLNPPFDIRFMLYCRDLEALQAVQSRNLETEQIDVVSYVEFQKNYKQAKLYHSRAVEAIKRFWMFMCNEDVEIEAIPEWTNAITQAEKPADQAYRLLVQKFPQSRRLLQTYALFLEEVKRDYQGSRQIRQRVMEIEDERGDGATTEAPTEVSSAIMEPMLGEGENEAVLRHIRYRKGMMDYKSPAIKRLAIVVGAGTLLLVGLLVASYAMGVVSLNNSRDLARYLVLAWRRVGSSGVMFAANRNGVLAAVRSSSPELAYYQSMLSGAAASVRAAHRELYNNTFPWSPMDGLWDTANVEMQLICDPSVGSVSWKQTSWDAVNSLTNCAMQLASLPADEPKKRYTDGLEACLTMNSKGPLPRVLKDLPWFLLDTHDSSNAAHWLQQTVLGSSGLLVVIILGAGCFFPSLRQVRRERYKTLEILMEIPKDVVRSTFNSLATNEAAFNETGLLRDVHQMQFNSTHEFGASMGSTNILSKTRKMTRTLDRRPKLPRDNFIQRMSKRFKVALAVLTVPFVVLLIYSAAGGVPNAGAIMASGGRLAAMQTVYWVHREHVAANTSVDPFWTSSLADALRVMEMFHVSLKMGNKTMHTSPVDKGGAHAKLLYETPCLVRGMQGCDSIPTSGEFSTLHAIPPQPGLDGLLSFFSDNAKLPRDPNAVKNARAVAENGLAAALEESVREHAKGYNSGLSLRFVLLTVTYIAFVVAVLLVYALILRRMLALMREESMKTNSMLLLIPPEQLEDLSEVRDYLEQAVQREGIITHNESDADCVVLVSGRDARIVNIPIGGEHVLGTTDTKLVGTIVSSLFVQSPFDYTSNSFSSSKRKNNVKKLREMVGSRRYNTVLRLPDKTTRSARMAVTYMAQSDLFKVLLFVKKHVDNEYGDLSVDSGGSDAFGVHHISIPRVLCRYALGPVLVVMQSGKVTDGNDAALQLLGLDSVNSVHSVHEVVRYDDGGPIMLVPSKHTHAVFGMQHPLKTGTVDISSASSSMVEHMILWMHEDKKTGQNINTIDDFYISCRKEDVAATRKLLQMLLLKDRCTLAINSAEEIVVCNNAVSTQFGGSMHQLQGRLLQDFMLILNDALDEAATDEIKKFEGVLVAVGHVNVTGEYGLIRAPEDSTDALCIISFIARPDPIIQSLDSTPRKKVSPRLAEPRGRKVAPMSVESSHAWRDEPTSSGDMEMDLLQHPPVGAASLPNIRKRRTADKDSMNSTTETKLGRMRGLLPGKSNNNVTHFRKKKNGIPMRPIPPSQMGATFEQLNDTFESAMERTMIFGETSEFDVTFNSDDAPLLGTPGT